MGMDEVEEGNPHFLVSEVTSRLADSFFNWIPVDLRVKKDGLWALFGVVR